MPSPATTPSPALSQRLRAARARARLTITAASDAAGLDRSVYARIESGRRAVRYSDLEQIARALSCTVRSLIPPHAPGPTP
jgi:transcriptional regulator with XRE-family HTH domain